MTSPCDCDAIARRGLCFLTSESETMCDSPADALEAPPPPSSSSSSTSRRVIPKRSCRSKRRRHSVAEEDEEGSDSDFEPNGREMKRAKMWEEEERTSCKPKPPRKQKSLKKPKHCKSKDSKLKEKPKLSPTVSTKPKKRMKRKHSKRKTFKENSENVPQNGLLEKSCTPNKLSEEISG
eukprot:892260_1